MIELALNTLIRGSGVELKTYLNECCFQKSIDTTKAFLHCYHVNLDGNGRPRVDDFIEFIATKVVDYSIPRSEFDKAKKYLNDFDSDSEMGKLRVKAESLFSDLWNTGEGGELLLYILVQEMLKIPQLLCKMPLKTSSRMHYHGVDGIHAKYDSDNDLLALYWGESKLYKNIDAAITECFNSLKGYLLNTAGKESAQERDITLVKDNLDLSDEKLEDALVQYFDKDNPKFNKVNYRGVCLIGFDSDQYPTEPNKMLPKDLLPLINGKLNEWQDAAQKQIVANTPLETFEIHIFLVPFPSVDHFREKFLKALKLTPTARPSRKKKKSTPKP